MAVSFDANTQRLHAWSYICCYTLSQYVSVIQRSSFFFVCVRVWYSDVKYLLFPCVCIFFFRADTWRQLRSFPGRARREWWLPTVRRRRTLGHSGPGLGFGFGGVRRIQWGFHTLGPRRNLGTLLRRWKSHAGMYISVTIEEITEGKPFRRCKLSSLQICSIVDRRSI